MIHANKNQGATLTTTTEVLMNAKQAAEYLGVSHGTVRNWASHGHLPVVQVGSYRRYSRKALDDWKERRGRNVRLTETEFRLVRDLPPDVRFTGPPADLLDGLAAKGMLVKDDRELYRLAAPFAVVRVFARGDALITLVGP